MASRYQNVRLYIVYDVPGSDWGEILLLFWAYTHLLFFFFMIKQHRTFLMSCKTLIKRFCELQTFPPAAKPSQSQPSCCRHHVASGFYSNSSNCGSQAVTNPCRLVLKNDSISWRLWFQLWDESWLCCTTDCFTLKHHRDLTSEQSCQYFTVIQCVCVCVSNVSGTNMFSCSNTVGHRHWLGDKNQVTM